jgi:lysozyme
MEWRDVLKDDLRRHEGLRLKPYLDTVGRETVGYGHTYGVKITDPPITLEVAERLLDEDMQIAINDAKAVVPCFDELNGPRKTVVAAMAYNLGRTGLSKFVNTIKSIQAGDYKDAALRMLQSKWAAQVKSRARELAQRMSTGQY